MSKHDIRVTGARLYFLPVETRVPLKFGAYTTPSVTVARVELQVVTADGREVTGWGETPLSVQWVWPSPDDYEPRHAAMKQFCHELTRAWSEFGEPGHALEVGHAFQQQRLGALLDEFNRSRDVSMPHLAALVCNASFDLALHDAYGNACGLPVYETYGPAHLSRDLSHYLEPDAEGIDFSGQYPQDYFVLPAPQRLPAWHMVGGLDPLGPEDLTGDEPDDDYPVLLGDWIQRDGLTCLKLKLFGNDAEHDYERLVRIGQVGLDHGVIWLTADFNCTATDPAYVNDILDRFMHEHPRLYGMLLYVEQPFPYDIEATRIDVHSCSARKPLFMDESAHDWTLVRLGRQLGWNGVALKTCKTQTGALLSLAWARAHGMGIMVQDLTNPMLAQVPHVQLAAHSGTLMGLETNAMQFYPHASDIESRVHPGLYRRRDGCVDRSTLSGSGFGYRVDEIGRQLPDPVATGGSLGG